MLFGPLLVAILNIMLESSSAKLAIEVLMPPAAVARIGQSFERRRVSPSIA
jgi:hypothetical protein